MRVATLLLKKAKVNILFALTVASLPIQLGKFFFINESYVLGLPIDYRAITIYLSDILIILFLLSFLFTYHKNLRSIYKQYRQIILAILVFDAYLIVDNLLISKGPTISFFIVAKTITFSLLVPTTAYMLSEKTPRRFAKSAVIFSLCWVSALVVAQFTAQRSIGFTLLGERSFDAATTSIAHVNFLGDQLLRPYGTFPHPNVAAAVLATGLILVHKLGVKPLKVVVLFAILLTFSKATLIFLISALVISTKTFRDLFIRLALVSMGAASVFLTIPKLDLTTLAERLTLAQASLDIATKNPLFGIGSTNFIAELAKLNLFSLGSIRLLQPVHNVFLLILTENGIIGLLLFTYLLYTVTRTNMTRKKTILFFGILLYSSFDHFLWTLQQGQMLLWLTLGYIAGKQKSHRD